MNVFLRKAKALVLALLFVQTLSFCLFSEALAKDIIFFGINNTLDSSDDEYFSKFYPKEISIIFQEKLMGDVSIYENLGSTLIPVGALADVMDWEITVDQGNQVAEGYSPVTNEKIMMAPVIKTLMVGEKTYKLSDNEIRFYKNDIYLDLDVLNRRLGIEPIFDRGKNMINIGYVANAETVLMLPPSNKPETVLFGVSQDNQIEVSDAESEEILAAQPPAIPPPKIEEAKTLDVIEQQADSYSPEIVPESDSGDVLVLQLIINDVLMSDLLDAREKNGKILIPFCAISEILEFPIECISELGTAEGWFIREENILSLKLPRAEIRGKSYNLEDGQFIQNEEDMYIDQNILEEWLGVAFSINNKTMELSIVSERPFPFEERLKREQLHAILENKKKMIEEQKNFKDYKLPYKIATVPVIDVNLNTAYDQTTPSQNTGFYNIQGAGDLAYMTSRFYLSGDLENRALGDARFSMGRDDYKKELLGPLRASSFHFGDINSIGVSQIAQSSEGRGFMLTNRDTTRADKFDVTSFSGDSTPGWDVELYRNGTLIDTRIVGSDGRYEFNDVPILFGNNLFRILLLGAQGQIEEIVKNINTDASIIDKGSFTYNLSVDQKSQRLLEQREFVPTHPLGTRVVAEAEHGLTKWMTATLGGSRTFIKDGEHKYAAAGVKMSFLGVLSNLSTAMGVDEDSHSTKLTSFANYFGANIRFTQKVARNFLSEESTDILNTVKQETGLDIDRAFVLPVVGELNTGVFLQRKVYENNNFEKIARLRLSKNFKGFNFTNTLERNILSNAERRTFGTFSLRGSAWQNILSLNSDYDIRPNTELRQFTLGWLRNFTPGISNSFSVTRRYDSEAKYKYENAITFEMKSYKLFFTGRADSDQKFYAGLGMNFSLGEYPKGEWQLSGRSKSETGLVVANSFIDKNFNLKRDEDEVAAENVPLKIGPRFYNTDKNGIAIAENLDINSPVYIYADQKKFSDMTLGKGVDGYTLDLRPGYVASVDFPIFMTAEVEGIVEFPQGIGIPQNIKIYLLDDQEEIISEASIEFDGYFLFRNVLPGSYTLKISDEVLESKNLFYAENPNVTVGKEDDFVSAGIKLASVGNSNK